MNFTFTQKNNITSISQTINYVVRYYGLYAKEHKQAKEEFKRTIYGIFFFNDDYHQWYRLKLD